MPTHSPTLLKRLEIRKPMMLPPIPTPTRGLTIEGRQVPLKRLKPLKNKAPETRTDRISGEVEATSEGPATAAERAAITGPDVSGHAVNWPACGGRPGCPACPPPGGSSTCGRPGPTAAAAGSSPAPASAARAAGGGAGGRGAGWGGRARGG